MEEDRTFSYVEDGQETIFELKKPSGEDATNAQKEYNKAFNAALQSGAPLRRRVKDILREQKLWDDDKQAELDLLQKDITNNEFLLHKGGISLSKAKAIALELHDLRGQWSDLLSVHSEFDNNTAEGQADNARFNYLVYSCVVYNENKKRYFSTYDDFLDRADSVVAVLGAQKLANMMYGLNDDSDNILVENRFLKEHKFVDEDYRLINKEGHLVDRENRLIDEDGQYVNKAGKRVDRFGHRLTEDGEFVTKPKPFLDDDGKPIE